MEFLRSAKILSVMTLMSRIFGLIRDMITTAVLSAGLCDALILAWTLPNVFRNLFGEGALSSAFIPVFSRVLKKEGVEKAFLLAQRIISFLSLILFSILAIMIGISFLIPRDALMSVFDGTEEELDTLLSLMRILLPYLAIACLIAQCQGILNSLKKFFIPALSPILLNVTWIVTAIAAGRLVFEVESNRAIFLACGIMLGGLLQMALFVLALAGQRFRFKPSLTMSDPDFKQVIATMLPMILGVSAVQLNVLIDRYVAFQFIVDDGAVSNLFVGNRLMQFPFALIGVALSTAIFPLLSRLAADDNFDAMKENLRAALRISFFLSIPAAVGLWLLAHPTLVLFFQRGEFTPDRVAGTTNALIGYVVGIPFLICSMLLTRVFYAMGAWRRPVQISCALVAVNITLDLVLVRPFAEAGVSAATSIVAVIQSLLLGIFLRRMIGRLGGSKVLKGMARTFVLTLILGVTVWGCLKLFGTAQDDDPFGLKAARLFVPLFAGLAVYLIPARRFCRFEWEKLMEALARRKKRSDS